MGVDEGGEGLVALAITLGLPAADGPTALGHGDEALGAQLAAIVGVDASLEVDRARPGLGQAQADADGILNGIDADNEERGLALVGAGRAAGSDRDAGAATALDRPDAADAAGAAELRFPA